LASGQSPPTDVLRQQSLETRNLWGQVPAVYLLDGTLVRKMSDEATIQFVVPRRLRKPLFDITHSGPLAAHLGSQRTFLQLKAVYYWPGLKGDVVRWCRECEICAQCCKMWYDSYRCILRCRHQAYYFRAASPACSIPRVPPKTSTFLIFFV